MDHSSFRGRLAVAAAVIAMVAVACDTTPADTSAPGSTTEGTEAGSSTTTTTTEAPLTSIPTDQIPGTHSPSISDELDEAMRQEIGSLMLVVEEARGLPFLAIPTVTILDEAEFTARVAAEVLDIRSQDHGGSRGSMEPSV